MKHSLRAGASHYQLTPDYYFQPWTDGDSIDNTIPMYVFLCSSILHLSFMHTYIYNCCKIQSLLFTLQNAMFENS